MKKAKQGSHKGDVKVHRAGQKSDAVNNNNNKSSLDENH
jgi:hypothetical protein